MTVATGNTLQRISPPAIPQATSEYSQTQQEQINNVHRLFYNRLTGVVNSVTGINGGANLQFPYAMLMSDQDQASAGITSENLVTYNVPVLTNNIRVENGYEIWFDAPGQYLVTFSLMFTNRGNAAQEIEVWAKDSGENYPLSNTRLDIAARKSSTVWAHAVATITGVFTVTDPDTKYLAIAWWSSGADVFIENYPAGTSPARPAIPSVILTANYISRLA